MHVESKGSQKKTSFGFCSRVEFAREQLIALGRNAEHELESEEFESCFTAGDRKAVVCELVGITRESNEDSEFLKLGIGRYVKGPKAKNGFPVRWWAVFASGNPVAYNPPSPFL